MDAGGASQDVGRCGCLDLAKKGIGEAISVGEKGGSFSKLFVDYVRGGELCSVKGMAFIVRGGELRSQEVMAFNVGDVGWGFKQGSNTKVLGGFLNWSGLQVVLGDIFRSLAWTPTPASPVDRVLANAVDNGLWAPSRTVTLLTWDAATWKLRTTRTDAASGGPEDVSSSPISLDCCHAGDQGSVSPDSGRVDCVVRGMQAGGDACTTIVRCSPRLALRDASSVLEAAVAMKARLQDCGVAREGPRKPLSRKKLIGLSRRCGVKLCGGEADSLMEFVSQDLSDAV